MATPKHSTERGSKPSPRARKRPKREGDAPSGRFLLRIDPGLHATLRQAARADHVSLNEYCARKLAAHGGVSLASEPAGATGAEPAVADAVAVTRRAAVCFGADLLGVIAFGSWARGEAGKDSDLDLLIVVDGGVKLERALYQRWDATVAGTPERAVDVHIAHLPDPERFSPGLWGEVAIDGIVLFEREVVLSRSLGAVRRVIAEGKVVRRIARSGEPYWVDLREPHRRGEVGGSLRLHDGGTRPPPPAPR